MKRNNRANNTEVLKNIQAASLEAKVIRPNNTRQVN